jgi:hypothetical protein
MAVDEGLGAGLRGRDAERAVLDRLLVEARAGQSGVLVLRGDEGVGKTALLDYLQGRASGYRVVRLAGVESETAIAFAGLHQLCAPLVGAVAYLPGPQRDALRRALGSGGGEATERLVVGLAVLGLLSHAAVARPLLCVVDDAQWLDRPSMQALAFVARRLVAEPVVVACATRESDEGLVGLPELVVRGLRFGDARELIASTIVGRVDPQVLDRIVAETKGNPSALLTVHRGLSAEELAGGFGLPDRQVLASRIDASFLRRFDALPPDTRRLLVVAAAEPVGDPMLLCRAAEKLGIGRDDAIPAEDAELLAIGARVCFAHPLMRAAVYRAAALPERQEAHRVLAEATDPQIDPDRRAWHRAHAAPGPDEEVAAELERSAARAQARGGSAAGAAFLERAATLTPDPIRRGARALAAARAEFEAAAPDVAGQLLRVAAGCPLDEFQRMQMVRQRAQVEFALERGRGAPGRLLDAAIRLEPVDLGLARETHLEALGATVLAGRLSDLDPRQAGEAARATAAASKPVRSVDLLLDGAATRFTRGYEPGVPLLRRALHGLCRDPRQGEAEIMRWLWLAGPAAADLWDDEAWHEIAVHVVGLAREAGALTLLPVALEYRAAVHLHAGEFAAASALIDEADAIASATRNPPLRHAPLVLAAWRGAEGPALELIGAIRADATARGEGRAVGLADYATAVLYNGLRDFDAAVEAANRACTYEDLGFFGWALVELVEAGARSGAVDRAAAALRRLEERCHAAGTDWALGLAARSRALLSQSENAEALYLEAIERLSRCRVAVHAARAHLVYGEWLRREQRHMDAWAQLRTAYDMFDRFGAHAFTERTLDELRPCRRPAAAPEAPGHGSDRTAARQDRRRRRHRRRRPHG